MRKIEELGEPMKFKEDVAYIVTKKTIREFINDASKAGIIKYSDIRKAQDFYADQLDSLDYIILFINDNQIWYDMSISEDYTVDEITTELLGKYPKLNEKVIYRSKKVII